MALIFTVLLTSVFPFRLVLMLLLIGANVNSCAAATYMLEVRHVFGYLKLV
jgi:hypothetical protein